MCVFRRTQSLYCDQFNWCTDAKRFYLYRSCFCEARRKPRGHAQRGKGENMPHIPLALPLDSTPPPPTQQVTLKGCSGRPKCDVLLHLFNSFRSGSKMKVWLAQTGKSVFVFAQTPCVSSSTLYPGTSRTNILWQCQATRMRGVSFTISPACHHPPGILRSSSMMVVFWPCCTKL